MLAAAQTNTSGGSGIGYIFVAVIAIVFVVLIRRANQRRVGSNQQIQSAAVIGSEVMTGSGLYGTVVGQDDEQVLLEIAPGVQVRFAKAAIARVISDDGFDTDADAIEPDHDIPGHDTPGLDVPALDAGAEVPSDPPSVAPEDPAPHPRASPPDDAGDTPGDTAR